MGPPSSLLLLLLLLLFAITSAHLASETRDIPSKKKNETRDGCRLQPSSAPLNFFSAKKTCFRHEFEILYLLHFKFFFNVSYTDLKLITYRFII